MRTVYAIDSPWLGVTMDTGNFPEDPCDKLEKLAPHIVLVQAKSYYGGGIWDTLNLGYDRIVDTLCRRGHRGYYRWNSKDAGIHVGPFRRVSRCFVTSSRVRTL